MSILCPICNKPFTDEQESALYSLLCSSRYKGRTSEKKRIASAENGKKGGRPKKNKEV